MAETLAFEAFPKDSGSGETAVRVLIDLDVFSKSTVLKAMYWLDIHMQIRTFERIAGAKTMELSLAYAGDNVEALCAQVRRTLVDFELRAQIERQTQDVRLEILRAALSPLHARR